jgi:hypothetical protein
VDQAEHNPRYEARSMTDLERINIRLRCAEIATIAVSKVDVDKAVALTLAEKIYDFALSVIPGEKGSSTRKGA